MHACVQDWNDINDFLSSAHQSGTKGFTEDSFFEMFGAKRSIKPPTP